MQLNTINQFLIPNRKFYEETHLQIEFELYMKLRSKFIRALYAEFIDHIIDIEIRNDA